MNTVIACLITAFIGFVAGWTLNEIDNYHYGHFAKQLETELRHGKKLHFYIGDMEATRWGDGAYVIRLPE